MQVQEGRRENYDWWKTVRYTAWFDMIKSVVTIYTSTNMNGGQNNQNSIPLFIWTEKEGWPTLERGASSLRTNPELPTLPFHLDLPICKRAT